MDWLFSLFTVLASVGSTIAALEARDWWHRKMTPPPPKVRVPSDSIKAELRRICVELGLPKDQLTGDYSLLASGKQIEVYVLACRHYGAAPEVTLDDMALWIEDHVREMGAEIV